MLVQSFWVSPSADEWNRHLVEGFIDRRQKYLLYGLIYFNGFGHLLCISRLVGGSKNVAKISWVCTNLRMQ